MDNFEVLENKEKEIMLSLSKESPHSRQQYRLHNMIASVDYFCLEDDERGHYFQLHFTPARENTHFSFLAAKDFFLQLEDNMRIIVKDTRYPLKYIFGISHIAQYLNRYGFSLVDLPYEIQKNTEAAKLLDPHYRRKRLYKQFERGEEYPFQYLDLMLRIERFLSHFSPSDISLAYISIEKFLDLENSSEKELENFVIKIIREGSGERITHLD